MANDEYITIKEAAKLAGVNISTIYKNIKQLKSKSEQIGAKQIKYVEKSYSSFMGSYVVFCFKLEGDKEKPISLYHDDEKIIDMIIESAIINNYIDLANYYSRDEFSINEQVSQKHD